MRGRKHRTMAGLAAMLTVLPLVTVSADADIAQQRVVSADPVNWTPHVLDGTVRTITVVRDKVIVGGNFEKVREAGTGKPTIARHNIFAFNRYTGKIDTRFKPKLDGMVYALQWGNDNTVYAGGSFSTVNGVPTGRVARLKIPGGPVAQFRGRINDGRIYTMVRRGGHLYVGGSFTSAGGGSRTGLARLDSTTGAADQSFNLKVTESRSGPMRVVNMAVDPKDTRLIISGTFTKVNGKRRYQIAMVNAAARPAALTSWSTERYSPTCNPVFESYMRGMDFSPDGSYFVVVTTGSPYGTATLCDSAARWETNRKGAGQNPTWVNWTGGDTLLSVAVTGVAVYVGGHQRWMDNPQGNDSAGPGAKARPGIAALSPSTGRALAWNPTRTRGHGVEAMIATSQGLLVGSDTDQLGHEYHGRLGMFPLP